MENIDIIIEQYVSGELSGPELRDFEQRLQQDESLRREVSLHKTAEAHLRQHFRNREKEEALAAQLQSISSEFFREEKKSEPKGRIVSLRRTVALTIAAAAAVILLVWAPWQSSLYERYATHPVAAFTQMSSSAGNLPQAEHAFNAGDYAAAAAALESYLKNKPDNAEARYFLGICYLETGQYGRAEVIFRELSEGDSAYKNEGLWYLGLTALRQDDRGRAREYLLQIPAGSDRYGQARTLLGEME